MWIFTVVLVNNIKITYFVALFTVTLRLGRTKHLNLTKPWPGEPTPTTRWES